LRDNNFAQERDDLSFPQEPIRSVTWAGPRLSADLGKAERISSVEANAKSRAGKQADKDRDRRKAV
jgi:hypothetical protein